MKKTITTVLLSCFVATAFAQWNPSGDNAMTGNLSVGSLAKESNLIIQARTKSDLILQTENDNGKCVIRGYNHFRWGRTSLQFMTTPESGKSVVTRMHIDGNGNVGIGTENPIANLHVEGTIKSNILTAPIAKIDLLNINEKLIAPLIEVRNLSVGSLTKESNLVIQAKTKSDLILQTENDNGKCVIRGYNHFRWGRTSLQFMTTPESGKSVVTRMHIDGNGYVGIGTESPTAKLDVAGTIKAHEVVVEMPKGADFVFEQDYNLRPLSDVESFIQTNKHLPEVQSEKDMQANGVNMNEFQIKLLQKIEELTLYIIQQDKRIGELEKSSQN